MFPANRRRYMGVGSLLKDVGRKKKMETIKRQAKNPNSPLNYKKRMTKPSDGRGVGH